MATLQVTEVTPPPSAGVSFPLTGKRIAVIVFSYFTSDPRVNREASALAAAGAEVDLLCLRKTETEATHERINGVHITRARVKKRRAGKLYYVKQYAAFSALAFFWLLGKRAGKRYDLVHVHNMPDFLVFSALPAKLLGAKVVLDLHDPMPEVFLAKDELKPGNKLVGLLKRIEKASIGFADLVLTPNIAFRTLFASRSGPAEKIEIVINTPLEEVFPLTAPEGALSRGKEDLFVVMYHGTLFDRHGLHTAVSAFADLINSFPGIVFHIYGAETPYWTGTIAPLIERLGLAEKVRYFGEVPQKEIARAILACDLGVIPSLKTAFTEINLPTRIFEYLALGKPVLVPHTEGIRDYFGPESMLFFRKEGEFDEEESLAEQIRWVFEHPEETRSLVEKGQEVYRRHTWKAERAKFIRLISKLLN